MEIPHSITALIIGTGLSIFTLKYSTALLRHTKIDLIKHRLNHHHFLRFQKSYPTEEITGVTASPIYAQERLLGYYLHFTRHTGKPILALYARTDKEKEMYMHLLLTALDFCDSQVLQ